MLNLLIVVLITGNVHLHNRPDQCNSLRINYRQLKYSQSATFHAEYLHIQVLSNYANKYRHTCFLRVQPILEKYNPTSFLRLEGANIAKIYGGPHLPRQNLLFHGKTYFSTAKLTFPWQNLLFHGKTYFSTAKLTFPRQNLLFHGKTYFSIPSFQSVSAYAFPRRRSGNFQQSNMADGEEDYA